MVCFWIPQYRQCTASKRPEKLICNPGEHDCQLSEGTKDILEQFSIECSKTKTKVITLANHKGPRAIHCPMKTRSNIIITQIARKSWLVFVLLRWVLVLLVIGWESDASFLSQSLSKAMQNQSKHKILLTLKWKSLYLSADLCFPFCCCWLRDIH